MKRDDGRYKKVKDQCEMRSLRLKGQKDERNDLPGPCKDQRKVDVSR